MLLAVFSSVFAPFENVWWAVRVRNYIVNSLFFKLKVRGTEKGKEYIEVEMETTYKFGVIWQSQNKMFYSYCI